MILMDATYVLRGKGLSTADVTPVKYGKAF